MYIYIYIRVSSLKVSPNLVLLNIRKVDVHDFWNYWKVTSSQNGLKIFARFRSFQECGLVGCAGRSSCSQPPMPGAGARYGSGAGLMGDGSRWSRPGTYVATPAASPRRLWAVAEARLACLMPHPRTFFLKFRHRFSIYIYIYIYKKVFWQASLGVHRPPWISINDLHGSPWMSIDHHSKVHNTHEAKWSREKVGSRPNIF